jgi:carboxylate-amine ligase
MSVPRQTLELRICDSCPCLETVALIAGLFRAMVMEARERLRSGTASERGRRHDWLRGASWKAARSGLEDTLVDPRSRQETPAPTVVRALLTRLRPALEAHGDWQDVSTLTDEVLADGSAALHMRRKDQEEGLRACCDTLIAETCGERNILPPPQTSTRRQAREQVLQLRPRSEVSSSP